MTTFDPTLYNWSDSVPNIFNGSSDTTPTVMVTRHYGTGGPRFHYESASGTEAAPIAPSSGHVILDEGARPFFSGSFTGSAFARIVRLCENTTNAYPGCYQDIEIARAGSASRFLVQRLATDGSHISFGTAGDIGTSFTTSGSGRWWYGLTNGAGGAIQSDGAACYYFNRNGSAGEALEFRYVGNTVGSVSVSSSGTSYVTTSDARLKCRTGSIDSGEIIDAVEPHAFSWAKTGKTDFGFFAQELADAVPLATRKGSDTGPGEDGFAPWGVDNSKLVPILWAEVRSLRERLKKAGL